MPEKKQMNSRGEAKEKLDHFRDKTDDVKKDLDATADEMMDDDETL